MSSSTIFVMQLRRAFSTLAPVQAELPTGVLDFDLITPHRDTYGTVLHPEGAEFHSEARPWVDTHLTGSVKNVVGKMAKVVEQSEERFRIRVEFDMAKPEAAEVYRQYKDGFLKGCSVGFDPIEGETRVELGNGGDCEGCGGKGGGKFGPCGACFGTGVAGSTLHYLRYKVLEGSSCATPSNPMALCVRAASDGYGAAQRAGIVKFSGGRSERSDNAETQKRVSTIPASNAAAFSTYTIGDRPMKPEHRAHHRYLIGDHLHTAEGHMQAHAAAESAEHKRFHRDEALRCMRAAHQMARMIEDSMAEGHEDAPQDAELVGAMMRSCPIQSDAELASEWQTAQRAALPHAEQTFADVGRKIAGTPTELRTKFAAMTTIEGKYRKLLAEERSAAARTEDADRRALVLEIAGSEVGLEPGLEAEMLGFDPVGYVRDGKDNKRAGRPWSLEQLRTFKLQVAGAVAQVTRTAALRDQKTGAEVQTEMKPATPQTRAADPALDQVLQMMAQRSEMPVERLRAAAAQHRGGLVEDHTMTRTLRAGSAPRALNPNGRTVAVNENPGAAAGGDIRMEKK